MNPKLRFVLRFAAFLGIIYFLIQPFNWYCQLTQNCKSFHPSLLLPRKEGTKQIKVQFEINSFFEDFIFEPIESKILTVANRKNEVFFRMKNTSKKTVTIRPSFYVRPEDFLFFIKRFECLCFHSYKLKPGEEKIVPMTFLIDRRIEQSGYLFEEGKIPTMVLGFKVR